MRSLQHKQSPPKQEKSPHTPVFLVPACLGFHRREKSFIVRLEEAGLESTGPWDLKLTPFGLIGSSFDPSVE